MKLFAKLSALGAVLVLSSAFASADTLTLGSWAQDACQCGVDNSALAVIAPPSYAYANGFTMLPPPATPGGTQYLTVTNTAVWALPVGNSSWVSYAQTGPQSSPFVTAPNGNYFFTSTFDIGLNTPIDTTGWLDVQADDTVVAFLNGVQLNTPTGGSYPHCSDGYPTCTSATMINLPSLDFVSGVNTLTFQVTQAAGADFGVDFDGGVFDGS